MLRGLTKSSYSPSLGQDQGSIIISDMTLDVPLTWKASPDGGLLYETGGAI